MGLGAVVATLVYAQSSGHHCWQTTRVNSQSGRFEMHIRPIGIHWGQLQTHDWTYTQSSTNWNRHPYRWLEKFEKLLFQLKLPKLAENPTLSFAFCILSFVHLNLLCIFSLLPVGWHQISGKRDYIVSPYTLTYRHLASETTQTAANNSHQKSANRDIKERQQKSVMRCQTKDYQKLVVVTLLVLHWIWNYEWGPLAKIEYPGYHFNPTLYVS